MTSTAISVRSSSQSTLRKQKSEDTSRLFKGESLITQRSRCCSLTEQPTQTPESPMKPRRKSECEVTMASTEMSKHLATLGQKRKVDFKSAATKPQCNNTDKPVTFYKDEKVKRVRSILRKISHLLPEVLLKKTCVCQHDHGCFENVVRKAFKNFLIGFGLQMLLKNILLIAKPAKLMKNL